MSSSQILLKQTQLGDLNLKNKFIVAPLTRMRANPDDGIPNDLMVEYYSQRSSFGLIIAEGSQISPLSNAFPGSGGIYNEAQALGWKRVTDAVHAKGGLIMSQLWHCGRAVSPKFIGNKQPISSSAIKVDASNLYQKNQDFVIPHELSIPEIKEVIEEFRRAAVLSKQAGFDGVQLHGANGYLVDQFLRDQTNTRTDKYGGSIENRSRFCLEIVDVLINVFGSGRVSVRFSPTGRVNDMYDSNPLELMRYILGELSKRNLAFVEMKRQGSGPIDKLIIAKEGQIDPQLQIPNFFQQLHSFYKGNLIANDGISIEEAIDLTSSGIAQAVSFGTLSISNPDLPLRVLRNKEINQTVDTKTWFQGGSKGYTDFPFSEEISS